MKIKCFTIFKLAVISLLFLSRTAQGSNLAPDFIDLLNGTAFIHYIKVAVPGEMYQINGKEGKGWVYYEGSFQGETFWIKNCTNSIPGSGPMLPGSTVGGSLHDDWYTKMDGYTAKSPKAGATQEPTDKLALNALTMMSGAFGLSVAIKPGSLKLFDDNNFNALTRDNIIIKGQFAVFPNGRPKQCDFTTPAFPQLLVHIIYDYGHRDDNSSIPSAFTVSAQMGPTESFQRQFQILECEFGRDSVGNSGFVPEMMHSNLILTPQSLFKSSVIFSNNGIYQKQPNGQINTIKEPNLLERHRSLGWLLFILPNCALLVWLIIRTRGKKVMADKK